MSNPLALDPIPASPPLGPQPSLPWPSHVTGAGGGRPSA